MGESWARRSSGLTTDAQVEEAGYEDRVSFGGLHLVAGELRERFEHSSWRDSTGCSAPPTTARLGRARDALIEHRCRPRSLAEYRARRNHRGHHHTSTVRSCPTIAERPGSDQPRSRATGPVQGRAMRVGRLLLRRAFVSPSYASDDTLLSASLTESSFRRIAATAGTRFATRLQRGGDVAEAHGHLFA